MIGIAFSEAARLSTDRYVSIYLNYNSNDVEWCRDSIAHNDNWEECVKKAEEEQTETTTAEEFHALVMKYYEPEIEKLANKIKDHVIKNDAIPEEEFAEVLSDYQKNRAWNY